jgi:hypothetical protein
MNIQSLCTDVKARLEADVTTNGLYPTGGTPLINGIFNQFAPPNLFMPYIVVDAVSAVQDDCFDLDKIDFAVTVHIFASATAGDLVTAQRIIERVYGDGIKQSNRTPTYGLHRHKLVYTTTGAFENDKWYYTNMVRQSSNTSHDEGYYHFIEVYNVAACRNYTLNL